MSSESSEPMVDAKEAPGEEDEWATVEKTKASRKKEEAPKPMVADRTEPKEAEDEWATVEKPKTARRLAPQRTLTKADFVEKPRAVAPKAKGRCSSGFLIMD